MTLDIASVRTKEFPWAAAGESIYFNNASTGPLPRRTVAAVAEFNEIRAAPHRLSDNLQFDTLKRGRELVARLVNATPGEIALATNTTYGINLAAHSLPLERGDVVLGIDREFPANIYPWMDAARHRGVEFRMLPCVDGNPSEDDVIAALDRPGVKALALSWVEFASGYTFDLARVGAACKDRGIYFVVDAIQGLGPLTLDLSRVHVDILASGCQKWLLSPWGTGFVYVRSELVQRLQPHDVSWMAVRGSDDFTRLVDYDLTWRDDARRFEQITLPFQDFAGMNASLELLFDVGVEVAAARAIALANRIVEWSCARGVKLVTPNAPSHRAAIISLQPPDARAASDRLKSERVIHSFREGAIRLAPHWFNTEEEVDTALGLLDR